MGRLIDDALALHREGNHEQATVLYKMVLAEQPQHFDALHLLGVIELQNQNPLAAVKLINQAIAIYPNNPTFYSNRGAALRALGHFEAALANYGQALELNANNPDAHFNKGIALAALGRYQEALASYTEAQRLQPDYAEAHWNESLCRLKLGDFATGLAKYEWRRHSQKLFNKLNMQRFDQAPWLGATSLAGKTLYLHAEQGLGDTLQFCRYAKLAVEQGATVNLGVQPPQKSLLQSMAGINTVVTSGDKLPAFDHHCPFMSLPLAFGTHLGNIPADIPYLFSDKTKVNNWHERLGQKKLPRVGLVWAGGRFVPELLYRSIPLPQMLPLLPAPLQFISLQKELQPADELTLKDHPELQHFGDYLHDFSDTAALIELIDLVICIDTSVAHLAGAMGKPVWLLLAFDPDWRWFLDRDDSPWYPTMRLFRQSAPGDWDGVLERVQEELARYVF